MSSIRYIMSQKLLWTLSKSVGIQETKIEIQRLSKFSFDNANGLIVITFLETRYAIVVSNFNMYILWTHKILQSQHVIIANNVCLATIYRKQVLLFPRENIFQRHCLNPMFIIKLQKKTLQTIRTNRWLPIYPLQRMFLVTNTIQMLFVLSIKKGHSDVWIDC